MLGHLLIGHFVAPAKGQQGLQQHRGVAGAIGGPHVEPRGLDPHDRFGRAVANNGALGGGVPAAMDDQGRISAEPSGPADELGEFWGNGQLRSLKDSGAMPGPTSAVTGVTPSGSTTANSVAIALT